MKVWHPSLADSLLWINILRLSVLQYVGGIISPEMECPKLLWLKEHKPSTWAKAGKFLDLVDFLTYTATGMFPPSSGVQSLISAELRRGYPLILHGDLQVDV